MPGGGVGIFNGMPPPFSSNRRNGRKANKTTNAKTACTNQYGAPANGWGDRYGGIHSKSECDSFPEKLKAGCNWRFDWCVP
jgi:hypothetical protein